MTLLNVYSYPPSWTNLDGTVTFNVTRDIAIQLHPVLGTLDTAPERWVENTLFSQGSCGSEL
jgi:hypothetical protein